MVEAKACSWKVRFRQFLKEPPHGFFASVGLSFLFLLSCLYSFVISLRNFFYDKALLKQGSLNVPVLSIGNLTVGGSGKTPLVEFLARAAIERGKKVAILSRGYSREKKSASMRGKVEIKKNQSSQSQALTWGDEPLMLAKALPQVSVVVGKDRFQSGKWICKKEETELVLLDDGFQHRSLRRDVDLVVVDGKEGFGNGSVLPRGFLREPLSALKRAHLFVVTERIGGDPKKIESEIRRWNKEAPIFYSKMKPICFVEALTQKEVSMEAFIDKKAFLFSGIGHPESFELACQKLGVDVCGAFRFADHHTFSQTDFSQMVKEAKNRGAALMLTTEKDALRLSDAELGGAMPVYFLKISAHCPELLKTHFLSNIL